MLLNSKAIDGKALAITSAAALFGCWDAGFVARVQHGCLWTFAGWDVLELVQVVGFGSPIANFVPRDGHVAALKKNSQEAQ